jgi:hypothetical protein
MAGQAYCPAVNPGGSIRFPRRITFWRQPNVSLCRADLRMNENTFQSLPLKPDLDIITELRRASWQRGCALALTLKGWALIWPMDFRPDGLAQG